MDAFHRIFNGAKPIAAVALAIAVSACGSSSTSDDNAVLPDDTAKNASTTALKQSASMNFGENMQSSVNTTADFSNKTSNMIAVDSPSPNLATIALYNETNELINVSIALNDDNEERTVRDGTVLNIDPDETEFCDSLQAEFKQDERQRCIELFRNLEVQLVASSEDTGSINYFFDDTLIIELGYSPNTDSSTFYLEGAHALLSSLNALLPENEQQIVPETMQGAVTMSASTDASGNQNSMAIEVTQAINVLSSSDGNSLSVDASKIFDMSVDSNTGQGYIEFNIGALATESYNAYSNDIENFNLTGLTGRFELSGDGNELLVSNFSIVDMINLSNSIEISKTVLNNLGFTVNSNENRIVLTEDLNFNSVYNAPLFGGFSSESAAYPFLRSLQALTAPSGSIVKEYSSNFRKLEAGGPLTITSEFSYEYSDDMDNFSQAETLTVITGECFDTSYDPNHAVGKVVLCPDEL